MNPYNILFLLNEPLQFNIYISQISQPLEYHTSSSIIETAS
jgi:hypothetical protein